MQKDECAGCLIWAYQSSDFSKPEGTRMTGWCRHLNRNTRQDFWCDAYSDKAKQEAEYLARVRAGKPQ